MHPGTGAQYAPDPVLNEERNNQIWLIPSPGDISRGVFVLALPVLQIPAEQCSHSEISGAVIPMSRFMFSG
jgi:hypothetical protein